MAEPQHPTAFVSWAHRAANWTSDQADAWQRTVRAFADALRHLGVDADVDLYHLHDRDVDWTRYGTRAIAHADTTIIAVSGAWKERWEGTNAPTEGAGAAREADALHGRFDQNQQQFQNSVKLVVLPAASDDDIPADLRRITRFYITDFTVDGMADLLRTLHSSPSFATPPLGLVPDLPPEMGASSVGQSATESDDNEDWQALTEPAPPAQTVLDTAAGQLGGPVLELQLRAADGEPPLASARLRSIAQELEQRLNAARPNVASLGARFSAEWNVHTTSDSDLASALVNCRFPAAGFNEIQPAFLAYLRVQRDRSTVVAMRLRRNALSAMVSEASLTQTADSLLRIGGDLLPSQAPVVPLLRIGSLSQVSPGDPATLQTGSSGATFPWMSRDIAASAGRDSIAIGYLRSHISDIASELVLQLVADLDAPRSAWSR